MARESSKILRAQIAELRLRLEEAQQALEAIRTGQAESLVEATDLSEQKQNQQLLSEGQLAREVLEQAADAVVVCDEKGQITRASRTAEQLCGCSPLRAHFDAAFPVVLASPLLGGTLTANALRGAILRVEPATLTRVDGSRADLLVSAAPVQAAEGRIIGCVITMMDISEHRRADEALRESEQRHRLLADTMLQGVVHQDEQGSIISMNFAAERILGKTRQDFLGSSSVQEERHSIREDGSPFPGLEHPSMVALRTGKPIRDIVMGVFNPRENAYRWISIEAVPLFRPGESNPYQVYTVFADITERKQTEEALRANRMLLNSVLDSSLSGIMAFKSIRDAQGRITDFEWQLCNATAERMVGRPASDLVGRQLLVEMPGNKSDGLFDKYVAVVETGRPLHHEHHYEHEGLKTWFDTCAVQLGDGFAVTFSDITNRKCTEEALRASERLYRTIGESINYGVWVCAPDGRNTYTSQSFLDLVGLTQEQCSNFGWGEILHPDDAESTIAAWKECVRTGSAWDCEHRFRGVDGNWHPILARGLPVKDERGEITCWAGINLDISALKQTEEALREADRRKNEFLATLSHELRNPLAPIRNSAYVLERCEPGSEQAKRALAVVNRQAAQLAHLVDDLLDVTRITRNKIQLQRQTLDLNELARQAVEDQRTLFDQADVHVDLHPAAQPVSVSADRNRLAQIIGNLLQNAAKFTGRGGRARITVSADATEQRAVIQVADTGAGMTPEMVARLFQPFSQADSTLDRSKGGLGLGLALAKGLVALHGGDITARSAGLGQGAEFVVRLPLAMDVAPAAQPTAHTRKGRRRVLVIEDNIDVADSLRDLLAFGGHEVEVAYNGPQGLAKAEEFRPDVVFCDIGLPIMSGYEVARAFIANDVLKHTFLVALSGYAMPEDLERASAAGFKRHLAKPPSLEKLEEVLDEAP